VLVKPELLALFPFHHHAVFNLIPRFDALQRRYFEASVKNQRELFRVFSLNLEPTYKAHPFDSFLLQ
jgi:hypothetical protein